MKWLLLAAALLGCAPATGTLATHELFMVAATEEGADTRVFVLPAPGALINARLPPMLETARGSLRLTAPRLTADSAYFAEPPSTLLAEPATGTLHVSVCPADLAVCRTVTLRVRVP